jgi:transposase
MSAQMDKKQKEKRPKHRVYTPDFKKEAVILAKEIGSAEASRKLSIPLSNIDKWKSGHSMKSVIPVEQKELQDEIKRLKRQLEQSEAINSILKKTAAIFSRDHLI